jgi:DNA-binding transcriptional LysR family regulator
MSLIEPDLDLLRTFVAVSETQSFTQAGLRCGRTQSAISLQIRRLEEALGATLLERSPHRVRLTAQGEATLETARAILQMKEALIARLREGEVTGSVRIGAPEDFATRLLPPALAQFVRAHPNVALETTCALTLTLLEGFNSGLYDIVLIKRAPLMASSDNLKLWREPLVWVCDLDRRALAMSQLSLALAPEPCVHRKRATEALKRAGLNWRVSYTCESQSGLKAAVAQGLGVSVLPRSAASGLAVIDDQSLPPLEDVELALLTADSLSEPGQILADYLRGALTEQLSHNLA